jgi:hypothetical protein
VRPDESRFLRGLHRKRSPKAPSRFAPAVNSSRTSHRLGGRRFFFPSGGRRADAGGPTPLGWYGAGPLALKCASGWDPSGIGTSGMVMGPHAAFSAGLSALVIVWCRLPSPLGWAVMGRAFGPHECQRIAIFRPRAIRGASVGAFGPEECQRFAMPEERRFSRLASLLAVSSWRAWQRRCRRLDQVWLGWGGWRVQGPRMASAMRRAWTLSRTV